MVETTLGKERESGSLAVPQDRFTRMIRILVLLMFVELVVVILLVDLRLDTIEDGITGAHASNATVLRTYHDSRPEAARPHGVSVEMTGAAPSPPQGSHG